MSSKTEEQRRPKKPIHPRENWTQADRELIDAVKKSLPVDFYFYVENEEAISVRDGAIEAKVLRVDRYFIQIALVADPSRKPWIAKGGLAAFEVRS